MRKTCFIAGCLSLAILLGTGMVPTRVFSQAGIVISPENPTEVDSLELTITAECCMMPVLIHSTSLEFSDGLIKVVAERECGPFMMATLYTHTVIVPPVEPDTYIVEYWVTGDCLMPPNPILSTEIVVLPATVGIGQSTWGVIKALNQ
jgi:hypothetical protein